MSNPSDAKSDVSSILNARTNFYAEENAKFEAVFVKLKLIDPSQAPSHDLEPALEKLVKLQQKFRTKDASKNSVILAHAHELRKRQDFVERCKICIQIYLRLNEKLSNDITRIKTKLKFSQTEINGILKLGTEEFRVVEEKVKSYEHELIKFEKKYPWLKHPDQDLSHFAQNIEAITEMMRIKASLEEELKHFHGLKPDLKEANDQLIEIKNEYQSIKQKLFLDKNQ